MNKPTLLREPEPSGASRAQRQPSAPRQLRAVVVVVALLIALGGGAFLAQRYAARILETAKLREFISRRAGRELGGDAGLHPLKARGFRVDSLGMVVTAAPPRALTELRAHRLSASFSLLELWRGKWRIDRIEADHLQAAYGREAARLLDRAEFPNPELLPPATQQSILGVDIRKVSIARADLFWRDPEKDGGQVRGAKIDCFPEGKNLYVEGRDGVFHQAKWPETRISNFKVYYARPELRIDEGHLKLGARGGIDVTGTFRFEESPALDLQLKFAHCPIAPFLTREQARKIEGTFGSDAQLEKLVGDENALSAHGTLAAETVTVKNIAALESAAAFTGESKLSPLHLTELRGDYAFERGKLVVRDFRGEAKGILCVQGSFTYTKGEIDGTFELGVAPHIVEKFPGAREEVFTRVEDNYLWTRVKLTGSIEHPTDDLKARLMSALEKHVALHLLAPLLKPAQAARGVIELIFPH